MSCLTTSATRRSRSVPAAVLIASAAASSHEVLLVPMISVTLYTLITGSSGYVRPAPRACGASLSQSRPSMQPGDRRVARADPQLVMLPGRRSAGGGLGAQGAVGCGAARVMGRPRLSHGPLGKTKGGFEGSSQHWWLVGWCQEFSEAL